jgi:hypothetical protein
MDPPISGSEVDTEATASMTGASSDTFVRALEEQVRVLQDQVRDLNEQLLNTVKVNRLDVLRDWIQLKLGEPSNHKSH